MFLLFISALLFCMYIVFFLFFFVSLGTIQFVRIGATFEIGYGMGWDGGGYLGFDFFSFFFS